ncbi:uncharacterized protein LOC111105895 [Crassostrea virginica]
MGKTDPSSVTEDNFSGALNVNSTVNIPSQHNFFLSNDTIAIIVGTVLGIVVVIIVFLIVCCHCKKKRRFLVNQQRSKSDDSVIYANVAPCIRGNNVTMNMNTLTPHTYAIPQIGPNTVGDKCLQKGNGGYDKIHYIYVE